MSLRPGRRPHHRPDLDALRGATTLLVVLHHTAITYGATGGWYYRESLPGPSLSSQALMFFCTFNQAWFMGLFFLLAGYFTPPALAARGVWGFLRARLVRLGLPLLVYGLLIGPATIALAATARGARFDEVFMTLLRRGSFENGPLWFAQALLWLSLGAAVMWAVKTRRDAATGCTPPSVPAPWPSGAVLALGAVGTGAAAWLLRQAWPVGASVWGLQPGYFASYVVLFAFGCLAARHQWLAQLPPDTVRLWRRVAALALPVLPVLYLLGGIHPVLRGEVLELAYAFWEPLVAWGVLLWLLARFQRHCAQPGPVWQALSRRAFAIYVIHPPVLVAIALCWRGVEAPALLKFGVTGSLACLMCFLLAGWLLRLRSLERIL